MKHVDVVTIGSALKDITFYSDQIEVLKNSPDLKRQKLMAMEYGAKIEVENAYVNYGGGALNVGVGLHNFGLKVAPLINIGNDLAGQEIYYFLKKKKIDLSLVKIDKNRATGFSLILTTPVDNEHVIFAFKGSSRFLQLPNVDQIKADWFYVSALSMPGWQNMISKLVKRVSLSKDSKKPIKIAWNPGSKQLKDYQKMKPLLPLVEVLILNKDEAIELVLNMFKWKVDKNKVNQPRYLLDQLKKTGVKYAIITAGSHGVYGIDDKGKYHYQASKSKYIVDTVGAGDAFSSGFLAGFHKSGKFEKGLILGIRNSAAVLTKIGAQNGLLTKM